MASNGDFGFGDLDDFDIGGSDFDLDNSDMDFDSNFSTASSDYNQDNEFGDLESGNNSSKRDVRKTALVAIVCGILLIVIVFFVVRVINNLNNRQTQVETNNQQYTSQSVDTPQNNVVQQPQQIQQPVQQVQQPQQIQQQPQQNLAVQNQTVQSSTGSKLTGGNSGWIEFNTLGDPVTFQNEYVSTIFTVTSVKHFVKVMGSETIELKTVAYGILSGFEGTYELNIPYSSGFELGTGDKLDVQVHIGNKADGTTVIDNIVY